MSVARQTLSIGGRDIVASVTDDKPLLFLLRMASRGMGVWDTVWEGLAQRFSVAQFDLGMPSLDALTQPDRVFREFAATCAATATAMGRETFHVFGWNGGTHAALRCAIDFPARVESCLLLGPFADPADRRALDRGVEFLRVMLECGDRELYAYYWFMAGLSPDFVARHFDDVERMANARLAGDRFLALDVERAMRWIRALRHSHASDEELANIDCPTLVLGHSEDRWHAGPTVEMAQQVHARIPGSRIAVLQGFGSLVLLEAPEVFFAQAEPFFESVLGRRQP